MRDTLFSSKSTAKICFVVKTTEIFFVLCLPPLFVRGKSFAKVFLCGETTAKIFFVVKPTLKYFCVFNPRYIWSFLVVKPQLN